LNYGTIFEKSENPNPKISEAGISPAEAK
jgi:hypothetical protein